MKKLLLVLAGMLLLVACIPVEDFGAYWGKAGVDQALAGSWKHIAASPDQTREHGYGIGDIMHFVERDGAYEESFNEGKAPGDLPAGPYKTLVIGKYRFLACGGKSGLIERYRVNGNELTFCDAFGPKQVEFVQANFPRVANLKKNPAEGSYLVIKLFDDEVFQVLSKIPDTDDYWVCDTKYERVRGRESAQQAIRGAARP
ncbi:MAG TPA: hypothetical protein VMB25_17630 [Bryobacteraceae bacterium]|nr:hypothetical protein [Bryobacteraceae bacterium]